MTSPGSRRSIVFWALVASKIAFFVEGNPAMKVARIPSDATLVHVIELFLGKGEAFHSLESLPPFTPPETRRISRILKPETQEETDNVFGEATETSMEPDEATDATPGVDKEAYKVGESPESAATVKTVLKDEIRTQRWTRSFEAAEDEDSKKAPLDLGDAYQATWD